MPVLARLAPMLWSWSILAVLVVVTYLVLVAMPSPTGPRLQRARGVIDTIKWFLPFARGYERFEGIRLFAQALQIQLSGGAPIREALKGACSVPINGWAARKLQRLHADVETGVPLSSAAARTGLFPRRFVHLLAMSEAGGVAAAGLPGLDEIVVSCDDACDRIVHWVTALVLPVIVLCLGVAVCALCLNVFLMLASLTYEVLGATLNP